MDPINNPTPHTPTHPHTSFPPIVSRPRSVVSFGGTSGAHITPRAATLASGGSILQASSARLQQLFKWASGLSKAAVSSDEPIHIRNMLNDMAEASSAMATSVHDSTTAILTYLQFDPSADTGRLGPALLRALLALRAPALHLARECVCVVCVWVCGCVCVCVCVVDVCVCVCVCVYIFVFTCLCCCCRSCCYYVCCLLLLLF